MSRGHKKASKKPKDLNAPKKNQSSYFVFSNERRPVLQLSNRGVAVTEISKTISGEWKAMDESQKKPYEDRAAQQKRDYVLAFAEYKKTSNYASYSLKLSEWKAKETALGHIGKGSKSGRSAHTKGGKKAPKKPKQPDAMPKRPQSSYFVFSNVRRVELRSEYPEKKLTELSKLIAEEWKNLSCDSKKIYEDRAGILKEKYNVSIAVYKKTQEYESYVARIAEWKIEKKRWDESDFEEEMKVSLPRKPKDAKCPKRPLTSYFLYAKEVRGATKEEFPNKAITEIAKEISKKWKVLTEEEKIPYNKEAARLKEQYKKDMAEYDGSESQIAFQKKLQEWKVECDRRKQAAKAKAKKKREAQLIAKKKKKKKKSPKKKTKKSQKKKKQRMEVSESDESSDSDSDSSASSDSDSSASDSSNSDSSNSDSDSSSDSSSE